MSVEVVIVGAARTAQGKLQGSLSTVPAHELGATAIRGALRRAGVDAEHVKAVVMGQVLQAGCGQNPARQAAIAAGVPWSVPAGTVNRVCLSGLSAILDAARLIRLGEVDVAVAGGMESMSLAPHLMPRSRAGWRYGSIEVLDHMAYDALTDAFERDSMGASTERHNARFAVGRDVQDAWAARSHERAALAQAEGAFDAEIEPVEVPQRRGEAVRVTVDEGVRGDTTADALARLRPAFSADGTITAGNASQISDGAAAVVLTTRERAAREGWTVMASLGAHGQVAGPDPSLQEQPARAIEAACAAEGISHRDIDVIEINEAFGAVVARSRELLDVDEDRVNIHGGGIALGHPVGASGARLVVHAAHELARRGAGTAVAALCGGGGQGDALLLRA